ncbi:MAG: hypothetical protein M0Z27_05180 [Thermaerobacter sp.]|nr:hypothetical protein [Thermaerobacter sp.]MDA8145443.1 hypothetical protein [Thermaerobacter sp.]
MGWGEALALRGRETERVLPGRERRGSVHALLSERMSDHLTAVRGFAQLSLRRGEGRYAAEVLREADNLWRILSWAQCLAHPTQEGPTCADRILRQVAASFAGEVPLRVVSPQTAVFPVGEAELQAMAECMVQNVREAGLAGPLVLEAVVRAPDVCLGLRGRGAPVGEWPRGAALAVLCALAERRGGRVCIRRADDLASIKVCWRQ